MVRTALLRVFAALPKEDHIFLVLGGRIVAALAGFFAEGGSAENYVKLNFHTFGR